MAKFNNVQDLVAELTEDNTLKNNILNNLQERKISQFLFELRCRHEFTQKEMAKKLNVTQSKISKLESSLDQDVGVKDLASYGKALNLNLEIGFRNKDTKLYDLVKYHACKMKSYMDEICKLAGDDESIQIGALHGGLEALYNVSLMIQDTISKLPIIQELKKSDDELVHITPPLYDDKEENHIKDIALTNKTLALA